MSIDVDRLADEVVRGARLMIDKAVAVVRAENDALRSEVAALVERVAAAESRAMVPGPQGAQGEPGADGKDGADGRDGVDGINGKDGLNGRDGVDGKDGLPGSEGPAGRDGVDGINGKDGADGLNGKDGADGINGKDGRLPIVKAWADQVHYAGDCVAHSGATWQASRDTGQAPPHGDWVCIAAAGRSLAVRGTYSPDDQYKGLDIVAMNGGSFVALTDDPGECPGAGWQLLTSPGKRGMKGEDGLRGLQGEKGERGNPGASPLALTVDEEGLLVLTMDSGQELSADFYPVLARVAK